jgi:energy-converting hydrogenase B subunit D
MIWEIDFWLLVILVVSAIVALEVCDLIAAVAVLTAYSFFMAVLFAQLGAIDVAFVEATLGAGVSGVIFIITIYHTKRRTED